MNIEKEIEEVRDIIARIVVGHENEVWGIEAAARQIIARAGYRKADEVQKETAKEIYERVEKWLDEIVPNTREETLLICLLGWIKTKYDVYNDFDEVDE